MKYLYLILIPFFLSVGSNTNAQTVTAADDASNYTESDFTSEGNLGFGFGSWGIDAEDGGRFLGTATNNGASNSDILDTDGQSFGMWAEDFSNVDRNFDGIAIGATFSFQVSFQWDNGNKGVSVYTGGAGSGEVFNFNISSSGYNWSGGGFSPMTGWDSNGDRQNGVALEFSFTQTDSGLDYEIEMIAGDADDAESNHFGTQTGSISFGGFLNGVRFYVSGAGGDGGNYYFNNLEIFSPEQFTRDVTFSVDMNTILAANRLDTEDVQVYLRGTFNGWDMSDEMTNETDGVYSLTKELTGDHLYKFFFTDGENDNWEDNIPDRLVENNDDEQVLDTVHFDNLRGAILDGRAGWRTLSIPNATGLDVFLSSIWTQGVPGSDFPGSGEAAPNVLVLDIATDSWQPVSTLEQSMDAGTGFAVWMYARDDHSDPATAVWPKGLIAAGSDYGPDVSPDISELADGFTLVGNPFFDTISWANVTRDASILDAIYVYDANEGVAGEWRSFVGGVGNIPDGLIAPFQGFAIENDNTAGARTLTFTEASKSGDDATLYNQNPEFEALVRLELSGSDFKTSTWVRIAEEGTAGRGNLDALYLHPMTNNYMQLSTVKADGEHMSVGTFPSTADRIEIPVHVETTLGGTYTLKSTDFELLSDRKLEFFDLETGISKKLDQNFEYTFQIEAVPSMFMESNEQFSILPVESKMEASTRFMIVADMTSTSVPGNELPKIVSLSQNYPNPFNPTTQIGFEVPESTDVRIDVFNIQGQRVATLINGHHTPGRYTVTFNGESLASGVYVYRMRAGSVVKTKKMTLVK